MPDPLDPVIKMVEWLPAIRWINRHWSLGFEVVDIRTVADRALLTRKRMPLFDAVCRRAVPGVGETWRALRELNAESVRRVAGDGNGGP